MIRKDWKRIFCAQFLCLSLAAVAAHAETLEALAGKDFLTSFSAASILSAVAPSRTQLIATQSPPRGSGLSDFAQVSPALYRSAQPTQAGVSWLAAQGVKTILKFNFQDPNEESWASAAGIKFIYQPLSNSASPSYAEVDAALAVINDPANQPVDVHCHLGHDRTGTVVAAYRVTVQGWSVDQAAAEALAFGYGAPGFEDITTWLNGYLAQHKQ